MADTPIPMTTTFRPPPDCTASLTYIVDISYLVMGAGSSCLPSGAGSLGSGQVFSPALNCPYGWSVATGTTLTVGNSVTETLATCCPQVSQLGVSGASRMTVDTDYVYPCIAEGYGRIPTFVDWNITSTYTTLDSENFSVIQVGANTIQIAWQATDFVSKTSISSSQTLTSTPTSTAAAAASSAATSSLPSGGGRFSTTAKIVVGVIVPVVVIAAIVALGFFIRRQRRSKRRSTRVHEIQQEITQYDPAYDSDPHAANRMLNDGFYSAGGTNIPSTHVQKSPHHHYES